MRRKIIFSVLWAIAFGAATLLVEMVIYAILGFAGIASWKESTVVLIGVSLSLLFFAMPILGLVFGLCGALPGTKRRASNL